MSRSNSVERDSKPLPPVPQQPSRIESTDTTVTELFAQTLKKMSQDIPTTQYKSPLNIAGRIKNELADMTREILVPQAGRATHHRDRYDHHDREPEGAHPVDPAPSSHFEGGDGGERITSAEKIRRNWEESQKSPERKASSHHKSSSSGDISRHRSPPTSFRSGEGFPWGFSSREHGKPTRQGSFRSRHRKERSAGTPTRDIEIYDHSDESGRSSIRLEVHNATPANERGRPGLTTRFRSSLQRIGVGSTRPARERTDISRSPSPTGRRSPSPEPWRKRSPHSSIRATEQYSTPRTAGLPDALPRIESQKMTLDWEQPIDNGIQSPARPPDDAMPTIPDLVTPGINHENGPRDVPILEPEKPRPLEVFEQLPSHWLEPSQATSTTAVEPLVPRSHPRDVMDDHPVVRNYDGQYHSHESHNEGPGKLKRLLSLSSKPIPVPIEGDDDRPSQAAPPNPSRPKVYSTPAGIIRSTSLIRTRSRRKNSTKRQEQRVDPDTHVGYESDPWGEGQEIHRDAHGNRIFPQAPRRKTSQKKKPVPGGPTKIALPMGQVEEFHSVHSNSPTEPVPPDLVSPDPLLLGEHKRTTSTTTFHTAQSGATRPGSPTRKHSSQSTRQAKPSVADAKYDGWRRSRAGAPRRPSQTLLSTTYSNGNQYADEAPILHDQPLFGEPQQEYEQDHPDDLDDLSPLPHHPPTTDHRSQSPMPHVPAIHVSHGSQSDAYGPAPPPPPAPAPAPVHAPMPALIPSRSRSPAPAPSRSPAPAPSRSPAPVPASAHAPMPALLPARSRSPAPVAPAPSRSPAPVPAAASPPAQPPLPAYSAHAPTSAHASPTFVPRALPEQPPPMNMPVPMIPTYDPPSRTDSPPIRTPPPPPPHDHYTTGSPEQSPPIRTPRAQTPSLGDQHIQIYPSERLPGESHEYEDPRHHPRVDIHPGAEPDVRSPVPDTPSYVLPRRPTPTLTSPGVLINPPSAVTSPTIDRQLSPRPASPARSVHIEYDERAHTSSMLSNRPMARQLAALSLTEQQQRQQNRQTGSEMSFVNVEPLTKREKLAASVLSISSMPWRRNRTFSRSHAFTESPYHSTHDEDSRYYDRYRQPTDYLSSPTPPQLPPVHTTTPPRPEVGKLPSWYPREQAARAAASHTPQERESRGPRIGQEAWGWRSSPHHGIPEETEETTPTNMPPWPYASGVVTAGPEITNDLVRGESMMTPPILPPRPVARTPDPAIRPGGEKKRVPKYRIEQDERGHPVLVPEPGFDDSRWTVFEIGGVEFKRASGAGENTKGTQWIPKGASGLRRPDGHRPYEHQYSDSPGPIHAPLEGRPYDA